MADIILQNTNGKIWQNEAGKILKARPFSETPIQSGLAFWGIAHPSYLTIVDGLVSEAYDVRGGGEKMIQETIINRPLYINSTIQCVGFKRLYKTVSLTNASLFIVAKRINSNSYFGLGVSNASSLGDNNNASQFLNPTNKYYYKNAIKFNSTNATILNSTYVMSTVEGYNSGISASMRVGSTADNYGTAYEILEWGWYNRLLTEIEVVYNQNALIKKYGLI